MRRPVLHRPLGAAAARRRPADRCVPRRCRDSEAERRFRPGSGAARPARCSAKWCDGLRQVLISRAAVKNEFRVERTMLRRATISALEYSVTTEDAVAHCCSRTKPATSRRWMPRGKRSTTCAPTSWRSWPACRRRSSGYSSAPSQARWTGDPARRARQRHAGRAQGPHLGIVLHRVPRDRPGGGGRLPVDVRP